MKTPVFSFSVERRSISALAARPVLIGAHRLALLVAS